MILLCYSHCLATPYGRLRSDLRNITACRVTTNKKFLSASLLRDSD